MWRPNGASSSRNRTSPPPGSSRGPTKSLPPGKPNCSKARKPVQLPPPSSVTTVLCVALPRRYSIVTSSPGSWSRTRSISLMAGSDSSTPAGGYRPVSTSPSNEMTMSPSSSPASSAGPPEVTDSSTAPMASVASSADVRTSTPSRVRLVENVMTLGPKNRTSLRTRFNWRSMSRSSSRSSRACRSSSARSGSCAAAGVATALIAKAPSASRTFFVMILISKMTPLGQGSPVRTLYRSPATAGHTLKHPSARRALAGAG